MVDAAPMPAPRSAPARRGHGQGAAALAALALLVASPALWAQVGGQAPGGSSGGGGPSTIFAGSMVETRAIVGATSFDKAGDPTFNPSVGSALVLAPRVRLGAKASLSALTTLSREFTHEDWTTYSGETTVSDTFVTLGMPLWAHAGAGLSLSAALQLRLPTSKAAWSNSMIAGTLAGVTAAWSRALAPFGWAQQVSLALIGRGGPFFHRYATGSLESPWLAGCGDLAGGCDRFAHDGVRNPTFRWQAIAALDWAPHPRLGLSLQGGVFYDLLPDVGAVTSRGGLEIAPDASDPGARGIVFTAAYLSFTLTPAFALAAGVETAHEQLGPDGHQRQPFFNRFSSALVALRVFPDALAGAFRAPRKP